MKVEDSFKFDQEVIDFMEQVRNGNVITSASLFREAVSILNAPISLDLDIATKKQMSSLKEQIKLAFVKLFREEIETKNPIIGKNIYLIYRYIASYKAFADLIDSKEAVRTGAQNCQNLIQYAENVWNLMHKENLPSYQLEYLNNFNPKDYSKFIANFGTVVDISRAFEKTGHMIDLNALTNELKDAYKIYYTTANIFNPRYGFSDVERRIPIQNLSGNMNVGRNISAESFMQFIQYPGTNARGISTGLEVASWNDESLEVLKREKMDILRLADAPEVVIASLIVCLSKLNFKDGVNYLTKFYTPNFENDQEKMYWNDFINHLPFETEAPVDKNAQNKHEIDKEKHAEFLRLFKNDVIERVQAGESETTIVRSWQNPEEKEIIYSVLAPNVFETNK
ncbi:MAG: hypothetical protein IJ538_00820 [Clostridia bacterium]|nr:hypothetical protein [Clostridia bacterium]